ncbi:hypothetical protein AWB64_00978 [Caballeronia sordidicola]|uniref:Uncharacterized protein n=1 Tax=Caballeronia sordidicola TaxID=196367 RepID=A0A158F9J8_CABSO|nr:hypothetical protein AWB64_00978 [Caballeronia sordidicola]
MNASGPYQRSLADIGKAKLGGQGRFGRDRNRQQIIASHRVDERGLARAERPDHRNDQLLNKDAAQYALDALERRVESLASNTTWSVDQVVEPFQTINR